jgi:hypothetical protein
LSSRCTSPITRRRRWHAQYAEFEARIAIASLAVISGNLPARAMGLVAEWTTLHQQELAALWERARRSEPLERLAPLPSIGSSHFVTPARHIL